VLVRDKSLGNDEGGAGSVVWFRPYFFSSGEFEMKYL